MTTLANRTLLVLMVFSGSFQPAAVYARPAHQKSLADHYGPYLPKLLNNCQLCHVSDKPNDEDAAHNPFGERLVAMKDVLRKQDKNTDINSRLDAIANEDSDGDGVANQVELLVGYHPGDPKNKPDAAAIEGYAKTLAALTKFRNSYRWKPFEKVTRPEAPKVRNAGWVRNPIDAFIAAEHEERGLKPRPEAARPILLRRLYLDLIGLPPTADELKAFLADDSADAYEKVVDQLLQSPRYGERWARHWMDVWRYSDWYGYAGEIRNSHPHIWRWRDWIVEAMNDDKGYDQMILEMLAGDELAPEDPQVVRATGYLVRNFNLYQRNEWLQETVDHTFQAFLGFTIGCARCHDHMYDPVTQKEYYQARAFFEPHKVRIDHVPGGLSKPLMNVGNGRSITGDGLSRVYDADIKSPTYLFDRGEPTKPNKSESLEPAVPAGLGGRPLEIVPVKLPPSVYDPEKRDFVVKETIAASEISIKTAQEKAALAKEDVRAFAEADLLIAKAKHATLLATLDAERLEDVGQIDSVEGKKAAEAAVRAQRHQAVLEARKSLLIARKELADPKTSAVAVKKVAAIEKALAKAEMDEQGPPSVAYTKRAIKSYPQESTGRRLALARWIADKSNPLTARVAMNHLWLRHFGQGIVPRVFDFGRLGAQPTHPALLDWLAAEFMDPTLQALKSKQPGDWRMKRMHRLMVTSATYRMASTADSDNAAIDSDGRFYWRMPSRRMEAEVVRDSLLHLSGSLDLTMGGPDIGHAKGFFVPRRSIYFSHAQEQMEFLKIFDAASVVECYERSTSVVPQQALALANSDFAVQNTRLAARALNGKIGSDPEAFVRAAFEMVLSRPPTDVERSECSKFLEEQAKLYGPNRAPQAVVTEKTPSPDPHVRARENLVRILINHNDYVTIR